MCRESGGNLTTQPNEFYTAQVLAVVCPVCKGVNRCLEPNLYGHKFIDQPHKERVELVEYFARRDGRNVQELVNVAGPIESPASHESYSDNHSG